MPEGVEVRLLAEEISELIAGKPLIAIKILSGRYKKNAPAGILAFRRRLPLTVKTVGVRGKFMWWQLKTSPAAYITFTLGMAGAWTTLKTKYNRIEFIFGNRSPSSLYLFDIRNFATVKIVNQEQFDRKMNKLGPDMFSRDWTPRVFAESIANKSMPIADMLISQKIVAGPGTYIIAESLYLARIHPGMPSAQLSTRDIKRLFDAIRIVAEKSYRANRDYISIYKLRTDISAINRFKFNIYGKKVDPEGNPVKSYPLTTSRRNIKWVPRVQIQKIK